MPITDLLRANLEARLSADLISRWERPCRPRLLILIDGLNYLSSDGFGLSRFVEAITQAPGVSTRPIVTLAHRGFHVSPVTIGTENYPVLTNFNFATAATPVTLANYDQIWIFGIGSGPFALSNPEVGVISSFMNGGGGVFATGDHAALGRLTTPRVRRALHERRVVGERGDRRRHAARRQPVRVHIRRTKLRNAAGGRAAYGRVTWRCIARSGCRVCAMQRHWRSRPRAVGHHGAAMASFARGSTRIHPRTPANEV